MRGDGASRGGYTDAAEGSMPSASATMRRRPAAAGRRESRIAALMSWSTPSGLIPTDPARSPRFHMAIDHAQTLDWPSLRIGDTTLHRNRKIAREPCRRNELMTDFNMNYGDTARFAAELNEGGSALIRSNRRLLHAGHASATAFFFPPATGAHHLSRRQFGRDRLLRARQHHRAAASTAAGWNWSNKRARKGLRRKPVRGPGRAPGRSCRRHDLRSAGRFAPEVPAAFFVAVTCTSRNT